MWDLPGSEIEPVSSALTGRFLSTEPPGKLSNGIIDCGTLELLFFFNAYEIVTKILGEGALFPRNKNIMFIKYLWGNVLMSAFSLVLQQKK